MELQGKRIAVLVEKQYQEMEVWYPIYRLREAGCQVTVVGPEAGKDYPSKLGYPCKSDKAAKDCKAEDYDAVVIPGGFAPDFRLIVPERKTLLNALAGALTSASLSRASQASPLGFQSSIHCVRMLAGE